MARTSAWLLFCQKDKTYSIYINIIGTHTVQLVWEFDLVLTVGQALTPIAEKWKMVSKVSVWLEPFLILYVCTEESRKCCQNLQTGRSSPPPSLHGCPCASLLYHQQQFPSSHPVNQHKIALTVADRRGSRSVGAGWGVDGRSWALLLFSLPSFSTWGPWNDPTGLCKACHPLGVSLVAFTSPYFVLVNTFKI